MSRLYAVICPLFGGRKNRPADQERDQADPLYALAGGQAYARSDEFQLLLALHDDMLIAYRARNFVAAKQMTADAAQCAPAEVVGLYHHYQKRFAALAKREFAESWTPMISLEEK